MRELLKARKKNILGSTIIEHRKEGFIVGEVQYIDMDGDSFFVSWYHDGFFPRSTLFRASKWRYEIISNVIFVYRVGKDTDIYDRPCKTADLYTIVVPNE